MPNGRSACTRRRDHRGGRRISRAMHSTRRRAHAVTGEPGVATITCAHASLTPIPASTERSLDHQRGQVRRGRWRRPTTRDSPENAVGRPSARLISDRAHTSSCHLSQLGGTPPLEGTAELLDSIAQAGRTTGAAIEETCRTRSPARRRQQASARRLLRRRETSKAELSDRQARRPPACGRDRPKAGQAFEPTDRQLFKPQPAGAPGD